MAAAGTVRGRRPHLDWDSQDHESTGRRPAECRSVCEGQAGQRGNGQPQDRQALPGYGSPAVQPVHAPVARRTDRPRGAGRQAGGHGLQRPHDHRHQGPDLHRAHHRERQPHHLRVGQVLLRLCLGHRERRDQQRQGRDQVCLAACGGVSNGQRRQSGEAGTDLRRRQHHAGREWRVEHGRAGDRRQLDRRRLADHGQRQRPRHDAADRSREGSDLHLHRHLLRAAL